MHCGYMPRSEWRNPQVGVPADYAGEYCPGWLARQPAVIDGMRAWRARDQKALEIYDPEGLANVWEMTELADAAISRYQSERLENIRRNNR